MDVYGDVFGATDSGIPVPRKRLLSKYCLGIPELIMTSSVNKTSRGGTFLSSTKQTVRVIGYVKKDTAVHDGNGKPSPFTITR